MKKAHVSFVLDCSSSMESVKAATISGFNEYIATLKKDKGVEYTFDLTLFDSTVNKKAVNKSLKALEPLTATSYRPSGSTALYDAVCDTIAGREGDGSKWIVCIMTDGEENSSTRWSDRQFAAMVKALQATGNVTFAFLGANQDAWAKAQAWGFNHGNVANYMATDAGTRGGFVGMAMGTVSTANSLQMNEKNFFESTAQDGKIGDLDWDKDHPQGGIAK